MIGAMAAAITQSTREAQELLRDPTMFKWYVVTLLALVIYVYAVEVERARWDIVLAGAAFWLADWINEIANALILHFSDRAPLWSASGETAYLILIGLTIEISLMFAIGGVIYAKLLPTDRGARLLGMPNRLAIGLGFSLFAVGVELLLNRTGYFNREYWWWGTGFGIPRSLPRIPLVLSRRRLRLRPRKRPGSAAGGRGDGLGGRRLRASVRRRPGVDLRRERL